MTVDDNVLVILRHYWMRGFSAAEATRKICQIEGYRALNERSAQRWFTRFRKEEKSRILKTVPILPKPSGFVILRQLEQSQIPTGESGDKMTTVEGGVKAERLSPGSSGGPGAESGSSRSGTPSSSCTPPRGSPARAYSDFMRSLAAKYNTSSEYPSLRNGLAGSTKPPFLLGSKDEVLPSFSPFAPPIFPPAPVIDMNATQALLNMVRTHQQGAQLDSYLKGSGKREAANAPLDLSASAPPPAKRSRKTLSESLYGTDVLPLLRATTPRPKRPSPRKKCASLCADKPCAPDSQSVSHWTVEDVAAFVSSLDMCAEYAPNFREQRIDGSSLPLLTEDHLTTRLGMRLGPALRLRSLLSSRLGQCPSCLHCVHCHQPPDK